MNSLTDRDAIYEPEKDLRREAFRGYLCTSREGIFWLRPERRLAVNLTILCFDDTVFFEHTLHQEAFRPLEKVSFCTDLGLLFFIFWSEKVIKWRLIALISSVFYKRIIVDLWRILWLGAWKEKEESAGKEIRSFHEIYHSRVSLVSPTTRK